MNTSPPSARQALRTLLVIAAVVAGVVIFSYGWTVTDIDLARPQEERRQQNVQNALQELFSPNIFAQEYDVLTTSTGFQMTCPTDGTTPEQAAPADGAPYIIVSPPCGTRGDEVTVQGFNFAPNALAQIRWTPPSGESRPRPILGIERETLDVGADGMFTARIEVPSIRGSVNEEHQVEVDARYAVGLPTLSNTTYEVLNKMVETIFLALIATALSIPISVVLSFFAARNLMKPVRMSLGNLLVSVALLPVGALIGAWLLGTLGRLAVTIGQGDFSAVGEAAPSFILVVASVTASRAVNSAETNAMALRLRSVVNSLIVAVLAVLVIGLVGGLAVLFGTLFDEGIPGYISNFVGTIGELIELLIVPIAAVAGAFTLSSIGGALTMDGLKRVDATMSHVLGGLLGAVCGAILLGATSLIGTQAALLGLLTPIIAAALGAQVLTLTYNRFIVRTQRRKVKGGVERSTRYVLSVIGAVVAFVITFSVLNVGKALIEGALPSEETISVAGANLSLYVAQAMVIGAVLGAITGSLAGTRAAFPLGDILYTTTRTILNALRSIEPLIMGLVFVIWVGIGPFAGVLALTLHSIASLGKLYSEQLENIDVGPIEALQSTGANRLQIIMYGAVPQIIPPYIAFTMYRWDINVRMSTIIGFVGGGGIGFLLQQQLNLLRYRDAGVAVLAIAIVVSILDYASATIREHYI